MANFPTLTPAFTAHIHLEAPNQAGALSSGQALFHVGFVPNSGFLRSEPGYPIKVDAVVAHGADYIKADPDGRHVRLEVQSVLKDPAAGVIRYNYTGTIDVSGPAGKVLRGDSDAATTEFGDAFAHVVFETGGESLKAMERKVYVAAGRFIVEKGKPVVVEYKISEVTK